MSIVPPLPLAHFQEIKMKEGQLLSSQINVLCLPSIRLLFLGIKAAPPSPLYQGYHCQQHPPFQETESISSSSSTSKDYKQKTYLDQSRQKTCNRIWTCILLWRFKSVSRPNFLSGNYQQFLTLIFLWVWSSNWCLALIIT